jgi:PAS domain-containing protein
MDAAPVMIWVSGTDKQCVWFNRPWFNFTGRDIHEELGDGWLEGVHPEDLDRCLETYVRHFDARTDFRIGCVGMIKHIVGLMTPEFRAMRGMVLFWDTSGRVLMLTSTRKCRVNCAAAWSKSMG